MTNTNWQAYSGESGLSYFSQMMGLTVQNFVSAATGIAVLFAVIRGFVKSKGKRNRKFLGGFDQVGIVHTLPLAIIVAIALASQGVVQNFSPYDKVQLVEPIAVDAEGGIIEEAVIDRETQTVMVDGQVVPDASIVTEEVVPLWACGQSDCD